MTFQPDTLVERVATFINVFVYFFVNKKNINYAILSPKYDLGLKMISNSKGTLGLRSGRGRPMAKNPLNYHVAVRLTEADGLRLADLADRLNRDRSELVREIVLAGLKKYGGKGKST